MDVYPNREFLSRFLEYHFIDLAIRIFVISRSPTPLRGEHEQLLIEGVEEDDEDSRLEAALRGELKAEALKGEGSQVRIQMPFISNIQ